MKRSRASRRTGSPTKVAARPAPANQVAANCRTNSAIYAGLRLAQLWCVRARRSRVQRRAGTALSFCALGLAAWVSACGGKYEDPGSQTPGTDASASSGGASSSSGSNQAGSLHSHPLGDCMPGFDHSSNPARACPWLTDQGECFDSFNGACACICPALGNSLCSAGFSPDAAGSTHVHCYKD